MRRLRFPTRRSSARLVAGLSVLGIAATVVAVGSGAVARTAFYACPPGGTPTVAFNGSSALSTSVEFTANVNPNGSPTVVTGQTLQTAKVSVPGEDNDVVFTGVEYNQQPLSVTYSLPTDRNVAFKVEVAGLDVIVSLGTDDAGASNTTAAKIVSAIMNPADPDYSAAAHALMHAQVAPSNGLGGHIVNDVVNPTTLVSYVAAPVGVTADAAQTVTVDFTDLTPDTPYTFRLWAQNECSGPVPNESWTSPDANVATAAQAGIHVSGEWEAAPTDPTTKISGTVTIAADPAGGGSAALTTCSGSIKYDAAVALKTIVDGGLCQPSSIASGTPVTLTAVPGPNSYFVGWTGPDCGAWGANPVCSTTVIGALDDFAVFTNRPQLAVGFVGNGDGTVTSSPVGINCTFTTTLCQASFTPGATVTLTAKAASGGAFLGWGGDATECGLLPTCELTMTADLNVAVEFTGKPTLTVFRAGSGDGSVTTAAKEINCSDASTLCAATFAFGKQVVLTATPANGSTFAGWGSDLASCYGTAPTCTISASFSQTVTAIFSEGHTLSITPAGNGSGIVTSSPSGVSCPPACADVFPEGGGVTLSVSALNGSEFAGWDDGPCFDRDAAAVCTVSLTDDMDLPVLFQNPSLPSLTKKTRTSYKGCTIVGTSRNDYLVGTGRNDVICGGGGNDTLVGNGGNDVLMGGNGNDRLVCGDGCRMYGGAGNDMLVAKGGAYSQLFGGVGNDTLLARNNARNLLDGGAGRNTARFDKRLDVLRKIQRKL